MGSLQQPSADVYTNDNNSTTTMSFNSNYYVGAQDQRIVQTPYGKGLITKTRPKDANAPPVHEIRLLELEDAKSTVKSKRSTILYSTTEFESIPAKRGDDVITPFGRGTITEFVTVRLLNKGKVDPITKEPMGETVLTKFHVQLNSWRLDGRSRVKCFLFSNQVKVVRKKILMEMIAIERVEFAMKQKESASKIFAQKKYQEALNVYAGCIDAVRYIQHDTNNDNDCRADLIEVMVTCSNNAATCCVQLQMWEDAFRYANNALILLTAMFGKRGLKIHLILGRENGHCDSRLFGEWRVKSRLLMARALFEKDGYDLALEELRIAREHIAYFVSGEGAKDDAASKASVLKLRNQEREIVKLKAKVTEKKKEALLMEKARAQAMFRDPKPKDKVTTSAASDAANSKEPAEIPSKENEVADVAEETLNEPSVLKKKVSFASKLEERHDIVVEEEEEEPWYEDHKEAFILLAVGGLAFASIVFARRRS